MTLKAQAEELKAKLEAAGHEVRMPEDPAKWTPTAEPRHPEFTIHLYNSWTIDGSDVVLTLWDGISDGCYGDICMAIALGKPVYAQGIIELPPGMTCCAGGRPLLPRAWALFSELPTIADWWKQ
jgi:nucleoside 2-deoxyribosyltransferase